MSRRKPHARRNPEVQPGDPNWLAYQVYKGRLDVKDVPFKVLAAWASEPDHIHNEAAEDEISCRKSEAVDLRYHYLKEKEQRRGLSPREWGELDPFEGEANKSFNAQEAQRSVWYGNIERRRQEAETLSWVRRHNPLTKSPYDVLYMINQPQAAVEYLRHTILSFAGEDSLQEACIALGLIERGAPHAYSHPVTELDHLIWQLTNGIQSSWSDIGYAIWLWDEVFAKFSEPE